MGASARHAGSVLLLCISFTLCIEAHACEAEAKPLMTLKSSWTELYAAAVAFPDGCFDGYFAEGISDTLVRKMGRDWPGFVSLLAQHPEDGKFMRLVLRSINATLDANDIRVVDRLAKTKCPAPLGKQCVAIYKEAAAALEEQRSSK